MDIYLVDNLNSGHHKKYEETLEKIYGVKKINYRMDFFNIKRNFIKSMKQRIKFINNVIKDKQNCIIHFIYLDNLYKLPFIYNILNKRKDIQFVATLHWFPNSVFEKRLLKKSSKVFKYIIVHSEYIKNKLEYIGIKNCIVIDYPAFEYEGYFLNEKLINEYIKFKNRKIISCLGATRKDKGLDILLESFKYINEEIKKKIIFNIAGKEDEFKFDNIKKIAKDNGIEIVTKNEFLTENDYWNMINISDIVLLPYKKEFSGNSGPMTDAISKKKFIIGPDYGNLGYLIDKYKLGTTFKIENPISLARTINELEYENLQINSKYAKKIEMNYFLKKHKEIYEELENINKV
ncbi:glycosyltransferase [Clostridium baratii]|uniref:glycosyltransferase n=1 Tax=Clostridium baratii TaxID=1561 RepID=UPI001CAFE122|nr:glycosyltransferase [Clostridium baratii]STA98785.1 Glycosyl transferases group 1 [Clostridium baratii]